MIYIFIKYLNKFQLDKKCTDLTVDNVYYKYKFSSWMKIYSRQIVCKFIHEVASVDAALCCTRVNALAEAPHNNVGKGPGLTNWVALSG